MIQASIRSDEPFVIQGLTFHERVNEAETSQAWTFPVLFSPDESFGAMKDFGIAWGRSEYWKKRVSFKVIN